MKTNRFRSRRPAAQPAGRTITTDGVRRAIETLTDYYPDHEGVVISACPPIMIKTLFAAAAIGVAKASPKSVTSNTGRISSSLGPDIGLGQRFTHSTASFISLTFQSQKPATSSRVCEGGVDDGAVGAIEGDTLASRRRMQTLAILLHAPVHADCRSDRGNRQGCRLSRTDVFGLGRRG